MSCQKNTSLYGGKKGEERHFRVVELDGKKVSLGVATIKPGQSPLNAASKLLRSIAAEKGLKKKQKLKLKAKYLIQEFTQGSNKKIYGPYKGHYKEYTAAEKKKAATAGGKVMFTMRPIVKLAKGNNK